MNVGVLALQGAFREHRQTLTGLGARVREVRLPDDLVGLDGLVIPGGESTTISKLIHDFGLRAPLRDFARRGGAIWGTCAGAILLATEVGGAPPQGAGTPPTLGLLEMRVQRNAFGRQVDSFEAPLDVTGLDAPFPAVFIRAPVIEEVGPGVQVLARYHGRTVLVRRGKVLASAFHPELTGDSRLHELFLNLAREGASREEVGILRG